MRLLRLAPLLLAACAARVPAMPGPLGSLGTAPRAWPRLVEQPVAAVTPPRADPPRRADPARRPPPDGDPAIADAARHLLAHRPPSTFRDDCSGFVCAVLDRAGIEASGSTASLWTDAEREGRVHRRPRPSPGDLVFWDDTWDRNGNGRRDDPLTHVGVVVEIEADGTIVMAHRGTSSGRSTLRMNLDQPDVHMAGDGRTLNDILRARMPRDPADLPVLTGQLFRGFARPPAR